jgi:predicted transcriptional regulator
MLFSWKRRRTDPPLTLARINPLPPSDRDWSAFEDAGGWPSIKVWLTVEVIRCLDQLAQYRDQTRSEVMRDLLFIALYGHFVYAQVLAERRGLLREPGRLESGERVCFNIDGGYSPPGPAKPDKKRENVRLFLPEPMKVAIEAIADRERSTVSVTARGIVERMLFGVMPADNTIAAG